MRVSAANRIGESSVAGNRTVTCVRVKRRPIRCEFWCFLMELFQVCMSGTTDFGMSSTAFKRTLVHVCVSAANQFCDTNDQN